MLIRYREEEEKYKEQFSAVLADIEAMKYTCNNVVSSRYEVRAMKQFSRIRIMKHSQREDALLCPGSLEVGWRTVRPSAIKGVRTATFRLK